MATLLKKGDKVRAKSDFAGFLTAGKIYTVSMDQTYTYDRWVNLTYDDRESKFDVDYYAYHFEKVEEETQASTTPEEALELFRKATEKPVLAQNTQVGGTHYTKLAIQPFEYANANNMGPCEFTALGYITRWKDKGGLEDLKKAVHALQWLIEYMEKNS